MKYITLTNILAVTGIILISIALSLDAFTKTHVAISISIFIIGFVSLILGLREDGGTLGGYRTNDNKPTIRGNGSHRTIHRY